MIDLHIHSTASDGTLTPAEVVATAQAKGLRAIALADHDTVAGIEPALAAAAGSDLLILPAVEISASTGGPSELHLLGYFIDWHNEELLAQCAIIQESRENRAAKMVARLQEIGLKITYEEVLAKAAGGSVGRPHVAQVLQDKHYIREPQEAFDRYLGRGKPAYIERYRLSATEGIGVIRRAGGVPVLSHPGLVRDDRLVRELLDAAGDARVEGVEAYHTAHTPPQCKKYARMAEERGLLITMGTDSHGPGGSVPVEIGSMYMPDEAEHLERLLARGRAQGRWPLA
ncbi:MAG TPA: PHP domain-containing protein [Armatimonadota bacterium]|jgi:hypothetical protein